MAEKDIQVCFNPHFDAVSLWLGSFGGADSPCDISRGVFAAKRGVPRLLEFFRRYDITTTWHITGHSMESFPKAAEMIAKDGHEIGVHGYSHENPIAMSAQQERDVLDKSIELCRALTGERPRGYATPWAEFSSITVDLLLERGFSHEYSMMEEDCFPYYLRTGDSWTKIDYTRDAADWMKPWVPGKEVDIVEIPLSWHLDDAPPTMFVKTAPNSHGWVTGQQIGQIWIDFFDWIYRNHDYAVYPLGRTSPQKWPDFQA
ncbi:MAG: polysaccharide deacetylase family protein [Rhodospirillales bacterium]|nr:polysaccharide deacetylase family protein [Rhodospirillales bacterium]